MDHGTLAEPPDPAARRVFGDRLALVQRYAEALATDGVLGGLIGPREVPRLWDRHLLNCAVVETLIPHGANVVDVGSGAGLPGIVLALARPDLTVVLVEPLARRTSFLTEVVSLLELAGQVSVVRGRAEEYTGPVADIVTARAVAPLDRLAAGCLPLVRIGGRLLAIKGATAAEEVAAHRAAITRLGGGDPEVVRCGVDVIDPAATVVVVTRIAGVTRNATATRARAAAVPARGAAARPASGTRDGTRGGTQGGTRRGR